LSSSSSSTHFILILVVIIIFTHCILILVVIIIVITHSCIYSQGHMRIATIARASAQQPSRVVAALASTRGERQVSYSA
jgi:hypothetical protein